MAGRLLPVGDVVDRLLARAQLARRAPRDVLRDPVHRHRRRRRRAAAGRRRSATRSACAPACTSLFLTLAYILGIGLLGEAAGQQRDGELPRAAGEPAAAARRRRSRAGERARRSGRERATIIGVDLGGTKRPGRRGRRAGWSRARERGRSRRRRRGGGARRDLRGDRRGRSTAVVGIGCGVPSVVDVERGIVYDGREHPVLARGPPQGRRSRRASACPAYVNNDANAFAVGELHFGRGAAFRDMVGVTLGHRPRLRRDHRRPPVQRRQLRRRRDRLHPVPRRHDRALLRGPLLPARGRRRRRRRLRARASAATPRRSRSSTRFGRELGQAVMIVLLRLRPRAGVFGGSISARLPRSSRPGCASGSRTSPTSTCIERLVIERSELADVALLGAAALYVDAMARRGRTGGVRHDGRSSQARNGSWWRRWPPRSLAGGCGSTGDDELRPRAERSLGAGFRFSAYGPERDPGAAVLGCASARRWRRASTARCPRRSGSSAGSTATAPSSTSRRSRRAR